MSDSRVRVLNLRYLGSGARRRFRGRAFPPSFALSICDGEQDRQGQREQIVRYTVQSTLSGHLELVAATREIRSER